MINIKGKLLTAILIITFTSFTIFGSITLAFEASNENIYEGIDVSEWQGDIDFEKVKNDGIEIVYIRASQGFSYEDSKFEENYKKAKENDLKIGVYHYLTARSEEEARKQAKFFVSLLSGKQIDCKLAMDFEYFEDLTKSEINKIALAFLKEVENLSGKETIVYSDAYNANYTFEGEITDYPLWIADYDVEEPKNNGNWKYWEGFQYTDKGKVSGISGNVDRDKFTEDIFLSDTSKIKETEKTDYKEEDRIAYKIKKGDTLSKIAQTYHTTIRHLAYLNNITNINIIYIDEIIIVSYNRINSQIQTYTVKKGDTLTKIAQKYNTTVECLVNLNKIKDEDLIYAGETLII